MTKQIHHFPLQWWTKWLLTKTCLSRWEGVDLWVSYRRSDCKWWIYFGVWPERKYTMFQIIIKVLWVQLENKRNRWDLQENVTEIVVVTYGLFLIWIAFPSLFCPPSWTDALCEGVREHIHGKGWPGLEPATLHKVQARLSNHSFIQSGQILKHVRRLGLLRSPNVGVSRPKSV